jgi:hypothetical protein
VGRKECVLRESEGCSWIKGGGVFVKKGKTKKKLSKEHRFGVGINDGNDTVKYTFRLMGDPITTAEMVIHRQVYFEETMPIIYVSLCICRKSCMR